MHTLRPCAAKAAPRFTVIVVLPTPPLRLKTAILRPNLLVGALALAAEAGCCRALTAILLPLALEDIATEVVGGGGLGGEFGVDFVFCFLVCFV